MGATRVKNSFSWVMSFDVEGVTHEVHASTLAGCVERANEKFGNKWIYNDQKHKKLPTKDYFKSLGIKV